MTPLNDLSGREWLPLTRSAFIDGAQRDALRWDNMFSINSMFASAAVVSQPPPRTAEKKEHPATFPEGDAARLIRFFTREGETVLDPFMGSGSTAVACAQEGRACIGFELYERWASVARARADAAGGAEHGVSISTSDAQAGMLALRPDSIDFILTSPPYWGILQKRDHKAQRERENNGLATGYGENPRDLSNAQSYDEFLDLLADHFGQWRRLLRDSAYAAVIVSDFRHGKRYYPFHADVGKRMEDAGFTLQGMIIMVQDSKRLYPYGFPTTYVPNICNQFVVVGRSLP